MYRIVVCIDIEAPSFREAYRDLHRQLSPLSSAVFGWETSDEAYDDDWRAISPAAIQAEISQALDEMDDYKKEKGQ